MEFLTTRMRQMYPDMSESDLKLSTTALFWWLSQYNKELRKCR